jgi:hypothetical protein
MEMQFTTIDRIFSKVHRDLKGTDVEEGDVVEWIGEALEFLKVHGIQEESVAFMEVKDFHANIPCGFQMVLQVAKNNNYVEDQCETTCCNIAEVVEEIETPLAPCNIESPELTGCPVPLDCNGAPLTDVEVAYYRPFFDLKWEYQPFINSSLYQEKFTPVRLASNTFFNSLVCKETDQTPYQSCTDEYTIVGHTEKRLRFSFKTGQVALSYLKSVTDATTGYPLVPDHISYTSAIVYYIKWKLAEQMEWAKREGYAGLAEKAERRWLKYCRQAKNYSKMPKSLDDYQDLLEQSHKLIPNHRRYYGFFGKINREEDRGFNNPDTVYYGR